MGGWVGGLYWEATLLGFSLFTCLAGVVVSDAYLPSFEDLEGSPIIPT